MLATETTRSAGSFSVLQSTLSRLKENKPAVAYLVIIFFLVSAFSLTSAYR